MSQVQPSQSRSSKRKLPLLVQASRKKTGSLSQLQTLQVRRIAKSAARAIAETKSFIAADTQTMVNDVAYVHNLWGSIAQGDTSANVEGEKIFMKNLHLRMQLQQFNSVGATNQSSSFRVAVVMSKQKITPGRALLTTSDVFRGSTTDIANRGMIDLSKCDILFDQTYHIDQPNQVNVNQHYNMVLNLPLNKAATFEEDNSAYFKDKTMYLVYTATKSDFTLAVNTHYVSYQWTANFKDM